MSSITITNLKLIMKTIIERLDKHIEESKLLKIDILQAFMEMKQKMHDDNQKSTKEIIDLLSNKE